MTQQPRTAAGRAWLDAVKAATLDPAVAKLLSPDGKEQLVALVNIEAMEQAVKEIEAEAATGAKPDLLEAERCLCACHVDLTDSHAVEEWLAKPSGATPALDADLVERALGERVLHPWVYDESGRIRTPTRRDIAERFAAEYARLAADAKRRAYTGAASKEERP